MIDWKFRQCLSKSGSESLMTGIVCSNLMPASAFSRSSAAPEPLAVGSAGGAAAAPAFAIKAAL
eukprot:4821697-Alexandrium_andersonii.AAC.1